MTQPQQIEILRRLDDSLIAFAQLESALLATPPIDDVKHFEGALRVLVTDLDVLIGDDLGRFLEVGRLFRRHRLFRDVFAQAALPTRPASDHLGFGFSLKQLLFSRMTGSPSPFSALLNRTIGDLPLLAALRGLSEALGRVLAGLAKGSRVLSICAAPALEWFGLEDGAKASLAMTMVETEPLAARFLRQRDANLTLHLAATDLADLPRDGRGYDLIICPDAVFDLATQPANPLSQAARVTARLFSSLSPGGTLIIAAPMTPGGENRHRHAHRLLIENPDEIAPAYRTPAELIGFSDALPPEAFRARLVADDLATPLGETCPIGALVLTSTA